MCPSKGCTIFPNRDTQPKHFKDKEQDDQHIKRSALYSYEAFFDSQLKYTIIKIKYKPAKAFQTNSTAKSDLCLWFGIWV